MRIAIEASGGESPLWHCSYAYAREYDKIEIKDGRIHFTNTKEPGCTNWLDLSHYSIIVIQEQTK